MEKTKKLDHYYRNHTVQQVRDDLFNKLCYWLIVLWWVMVLSIVLKNDITHAEDIESYQPPVEEKTISGNPQKDTIPKSENTKIDLPTIWQNREYDMISFIVIHHTATRDDLTSSEMKLSMEHTYINNRGGSIIPTHYIIDKWGNLERVNHISKIVWATLNEVANNQWVHIELVGDFNINKPTEDQYKTLNSLISKIENEVWAYLPIKWHWDFQPKNCPWVNFDFSRLRHWVERNVWDVLHFNQITAYYTPLTTDKSFSHWTYERSKLVNWDFVNAMWWDYKDEHKYTHWACWRRFEFWTILDIKWWGKVVCVDRWSAIDNNDIDIWYGIGEQALRNIQWWKGHPQEGEVTVVHLP